MDELEEKQQDEKRMTMRMPCVKGAKKFARVLVWWLGARACKLKGELRVKCVSVPLYGPPLFTPVLDVTHLLALVLVLGV